MSPVGNIVSGVTQPVGETGGGVTKPLLGGLVGGIMDAGKQAGEAIGGQAGAAGDSKAKSSYEQLGGKPQTAKNPLGL